MAQLLKGFAGLCRTFGQDRCGGTTALVAISLTAVLGAAALAVDYARGVTARQMLSSAADAAALAAASRLPDVEAARRAALEYVEKNLPIAQYGQVLALSDIQIGTWNPESQRFADQSDSTEGADYYGESESSIYSTASMMSVESDSGGSGGTGFSASEGGGVPAVRVRTRMAGSNGNGINTFFAWVLGRDRMDVSVSSVAGRTGPPCLLALNPTEPSALSLNGKSKLESVGCGIQVNSTGWPAFDIQDRASLTATDICVSGTSRLGTARDVDPEPRDHCPGMKDPMVGLQPPSHDNCDYVDTVAADGDFALEPGVYCGGLKIGQFPKHTDITLSPGVYVMRDGPLSVTGHTSVTGSEISVFFTGEEAVLSVTDNPQLELELSAPTSGEFKGILFYQDPDFGNTHYLGAKSATNLRGVVYFPAGKLLSLSDSDITPEGSCLVLITDTLELAGNSHLAIDITSADCRAALPGPYSRGIVLLE